MFKAVLLVSTGALALSACGGSTPDAAATQGPAATPNGSGSVTAPISGEAAPTAAENGEPLSTAAPIPPLPAAAPSTSLAPALAPLSAREEKGEKGAQVVVETWARALETHQFGLAWEQFGGPPPSRAAYVRWWERYRTIRVSLGPGTGDAAMGSLYYTVPATLTGTTVAGKPFRLIGDVIVRRVNDVDGATPAQLRWHIGTADLKDAGTP